ncbi:MAG: ABC transporter permease, partial [Candidatus Sumerlaeota bacterium]|nr:ABC transporter permease [Candidatus Sumerlaeota bacterium]
ALLLLFNAYFGKNFFAMKIQEGHLYGTLIDILNNGAKIMLLAIGMTLVIATGGVDLSVSSTMAISGALVALMVKAGSPLPFVVMVAFALVIAFALGLWNGILVAYVRIQPIVATLILMVAGRGIAQLMTDGNIITFEHKAFLYLGNGHLFGLPFTLTIVVLVFAVTALVVRKTALGMFIEAVGDNETASRFAGINARLVKMLVYGFCGACAGMAGLIATSNIKGADSIRVGEMMELDAIFAVIVGGTALTGGRFTLAGSIIGAILLQTLTTTMYYVGVPSAVAPVPKALVILAVCLMQSQEFRRKMKLRF